MEGKADLFHVPLEIVEKGGALLRMQTDSRTKKSIVNAYSNLFNQIIAVLIQFVLRTVFIHTLSIEYLGINGLFSNVLSVLSLTELGLGTALIINMYGPIARNDKPEILKFFTLYKKVYYIVGTIIGAIGLLIVPFIHYLVADADNIPNLQLLYVLFLSDTVASYFFAQYRALYSADQKDFVNANNRTLFLVIQSALQIAVLYIFHNYILYMGIKIISNLLSGYALAVKAKKEYPYITEKSKYELVKEERDQLIKDSIGVFSTRIELTVLNSTDTIILSSILGSIVSGIYSNYSLIVGTVSTLAGMIFSSVQASIGNYCVQSEVSDTEMLYSRISYIYYCIYGTATICMIGLLTPVITVWLGNDYTLSKAICWIIGINFYLSNSRQANLQFITVYHLLPKLNIKNILEALLNIFISVLLVNKIGMIGIFIGTAVSLVGTSLWYEPLVLHKSIWKKGIGTYIIRYIIMLGIVILSSYAVSCINSAVFHENILSLIICFAITVAISILAVTLPFIRTKEFAYAHTMIFRLIRNRLGKES